MAGKLVVRKPKTHFEQVPVAKIRKLWKRDANDQRKKSGSIWKKVVVERPATKTEPYSMRSAS